MMASRQLGPYETSRHDGNNDRPPAMPEDTRAAMYHFQGNTQELGRGNMRDHSRHNLRGHFPLRTSDRPLLRSRRNQLELNMLQDSNAPEKFRNLNELTDSDESAMEESDEDAKEQRPLKRTKVVNSEDDGDCSTPKWSNPNPYTSLPPPAEGSGKRKDVVKLIRKARNIPKPKEGEESAQDDNFISFDFETLQEDETFTPPPGAPTGPRAETEKGRVLGKRKRGDELGEGKVRTKFGGFIYDNGRVLDKWQCSENGNPTPWFVGVNQHNNPGVALHKEIIDFYEWVKPREFEDNVRADVIARISCTLNQFQAGEVKAFGSFSSGLYLPTADMDLVFLQRSYLHSNAYRYGMSKTLEIWPLRQFASFLRSQTLTRPGSVVVIPSAKVPLIKFVDNITGLKVDLSFNNETGVVANKTFQEWKALYPSMPILVSVVKQFLMIRGLNDVASGGLGGFSIICLVTSLLQHFPIKEQPQNLGMILLEFFNLYGNLFDKQTVAIRLDPPGYIDKTSYSQILLSKDKADRLTIIDPNRPDNNISGGTNEISRIFKCFASAHHMLQDQLTAYSIHVEHGQPVSLLKDLVGGDFDAYDAQREILRDLHNDLTRPKKTSIPSKLTSDSDRPKSLGGSKTKNLDTKMIKVQREEIGTSHKKVQTMSMHSKNEPNGNIISEKLNKNERRAVRMKATHPDLASVIAESLTVYEALELGGYATPNEMEIDLRSRETASTKAEPKKP